MSVQKQDAGDARRDDWRTPRWLFDWASMRWGPFGLDAAADEDNALCGWYWTAEDDGLVQPWKGDVWCNPPYGLVAEFCERAALHAINGGSAVLLVPASTDTVWFHDLVVTRAREIVFLTGRVQFIDPTGVGRAGSNHASVVVHYKHPGPTDPLIRPAIWWDSTKRIRDGQARKAAALQPGLPFHG